MCLIRNVDALDIDEQTQFANWLLQVGEGAVPGSSPDNGIPTSTNITLPPQILMPINVNIDDVTVR
ncbi:hypothetical protein EC991_009788, partial [Linnemannia zychae]